MKFTVNLRCSILEFLLGFLYHDDRQKKRGQSRHCCPTLSHCAHCGNNHRKRSHCWGISKHIVIYIPFIRWHRDWRTNLHQWCKKRLGHFHWEYQWWCCNSRFHRWYIWSTSGCSGQNQHAWDYRWEENRYHSRNFLRKSWYLKTNSRYNKCWCNWTHKSCWWFGCGCLSYRKKIGQCLGTGKFIAFRWHRCETITQYHQKCRWIDDHA